MTPSELGDARSSVRQALPAFAFTICINSSTSHNLQTMTTCLRCTPATATARQPAVLAQPHQVGARPALAACRQAAKARGNTNRAGLRGSHRSHCLPTPTPTSADGAACARPFWPSQGALGSPEGVSDSAGARKVGFEASALPSSPPPTAAAARRRLASLQDTRPSAAPRLPRRCFVIKARPD